LVGGLCALARTRGPGLDPCKSDRAPALTLAALVGPKRARSRRVLGIQCHQQISLHLEIWRKRAQGLRLGCSLGTLGTPGRRGACALSRTRPSLSVDRCAKISSAPARLRAADGDNGRARLPCPLRLLRPPLIFSSTTMLELCLRVQAGAVASACGTSQDSGTTPDPRGCWFWACGERKLESRGEVRGRRMELPESLKLEAEDRPCVSLCPFVWAAVLLDS
jgi:hypothetical protein